MVGCHFWVGSFQWGGLIWGSPFFIWMFQGPCSMWRWCPWQRRTPLSVWVLLGSCVDFGQRFDGFSYAASVDCW